MTYSKDAQLGRPTKQELRRAARGPKGPSVDDAQELEIEEEATRRARSLYTSGVAKYGSRWYGVTAAVGEVFRKRGLAVGDPIVGRPALAVVEIAQLWVEDIVGGNGAQRGPSATDDAQYVPDLETDPAPSERE